MAHTFMIVEIGSAGHAAGQHEDVGIAEVACLVEGGICQDGHAMGALHFPVVIDTDGCHVYSTASQNVDGSQSLNVLEAVGHKYVCFLHCRMLFGFLVLKR